MASIGFLHVRGGLASLVLFALSAVSPPALASPLPTVINETSGIVQSSPPSAPRTLNTKPGNQQVTLTWSAPSSAGTSPVTGYRIYTSTASGAGPWTLNSTVTTRSKIVTGLTNGTGYWFRVSAVNASGEGTGVISKTVTYPAVAPSAPQNFTLTPGSDQIVLSWEAPSSTGGSPTTGYSVAQSSADTGPARTVVSRATGTTVTITGLTNGAPYDFRVAAVNSAGSGAYSNIATSMPASP